MLDSVCNLLGRFGDCLGTLGMCWGFVSDFASYCLGFVSERVLHFIETCLAT